MKRRPTSTYRLQLHAGFRFEDAQAIVPYLKDLGVTEVYTSPILRAEKGSTHGYNVVDHGMVSPELGGEEGFRAFSDALRGSGLGLVVDFVPNHMGIASGENPWWNDVLENGPSSLHADSFDVAWTPPQASLQNKVLYPILGAQYGEVLENGDLVLSRQGGMFVLRYFDHTLPVAPRSVIPLLERTASRLTLSKDDPSAQELSSIVTSLRHLPLREETDPEKREERAREKEVVKRRLDALTRESAEVAAAVDIEVVAINGKKGDPRSFDALDALLLEQNYRLAFWRVATEEINYRRFFDVNQLVAVRMEDPGVFEAAHAKVLALAADGRIDGLRLDHTDGLYDPADYFDRLRARGAGDLYVVAEKILEPGEKLPRAWKIEGTTGYDALASLNGVWVDAAAERALGSLYQRFTGDELSFEEHVYRGKRAVIRMSFAGEINVLAQALESIAEGNRRSRDFTLLSLTYALRETMAEFPVYRTYIRPDGSRGPNDEKHISQAVRAAKRRNPEIDGSVFDFVRDVLFLRNLEGATEADRVSQVRWVMRFQQLTGPIMAKGVEDTAFYRYHRLVSLNEVGAHPGRFGTPVRAFHAENEERLRLWPLSMVTLSTHDTKRGEDVRARLNVISEAPSLWEECVGQWSKMAEAHREAVDDEAAPSRADEYLFYQTALGSTPFAEEDDAALAERTARVAEYMGKAIREEKQRTSWLAPNAEYEAAVGRFVTRMMGDRAFAKSIRELAFATAISAATTSLGALAVKMTMPGVPDTYQGTESWAFALVDPDNRRPVDYAARRARLEAIRARLSNAETRRLEVARELLDTFADGGVKLYVTHLLLALRRELPRLLLEGDYRALDAGPSAVAFARAHEGDGKTLVTVVPRLAYELTHVGAQAAARGAEGAGRWPVGDVWGDARVELPRGRYQSVLTGELVESDGSVAMRDVLRSFPVAVLLSA
jgi:(1->4)-alpha-D-glucan 1-alpha-D-glucosylmutase